MENRRKIMMWGCLLMVFLLTVCHKGDGGKTRMESTVEVSSEMLEAGQGSTPETEPATETIMESLETIPETMTEARTVTDSGKAGESSETDQGEFTWLDRALAEGLEKGLGELTDQDYFSLERLEVYGGDLQGTLFYGQSDTVKFWIKGKEEFVVVPFRNPRHDTINIRDIIKCSNLKHLEIVLNYMPRPETYLIYYEDLVHLQHLESLLIWLNRRDNEFCQEIADEIDSLSFICDMNNLTYICLENIDLPDDLSPLFSHHFEDIILTSCNLTEHSFSYLKDDAFYPSHLELEGNQIKDATIFTAMQNKLVDGDINAVYRLGLSKNPLEKLGDCLTNKWLLQYGENLEGISLRLYGTDFEEYSFEWMTD